MWMVNPLVMMSQRKYIQNGSHNSHLCSDWLILFLAKFQYGENQSYALQGWEGCRRKVRMRVEVHAQSQPQRPPMPVDPPALMQGIPPDQDKMKRRVVEAEWLEEVGRLPQSLPTQKLAQMAGEAGPSTSGGEEPARKKLHPTVGRKAPRKEFWKAGVIKKTWKYQLGTVALHKYASSKRAQSSLFRNVPSHG